MPKRFYPQTGCKQHQAALPSLRAVSWGLHRDGEHVLPDHVFGRQLWAQRHVWSQHPQAALHLRNGCGGALCRDLLFYTNSFLIRRRKKELGLFNVLGLEKRHIARILVWETLLTAAFSLAVGLGGGILLSKILLLVLLRILDFPVVIGFEVPEAAVLTTLKLFGTLFLVLLAYGVRQVGRANPRELLQAEAVGEREPKARWFLALLGLASLGAGYFLALAIDHPLDALVYFFVAVLLVIAGTYLLFTTGSIALLSCLGAASAFTTDPSLFWRCPGCSTA